MTATEPDTGYLFKHGWAGERARLRGIERLYDATSIRALEATGIRPGWRCLEVGGGAGSVARWMCERSGPEGSVVATDLQTGFLEELDLPNLEVRRHDIVGDPLEEVFDLIHARAVLEHVGPRLVVLEKLVRALRPGGWLVIEDSWFLGAVSVSGSTDLRTRLRSRLFALFGRRLVAAVRAAGGDLDYGKELPVEFTRLGLVDVRAEARTGLLEAASADAEVWRLTMERLGNLLSEQPMLGVKPVRMVLQRLIDEAAALLDDPWAFVQLPTMMTVVGRLPG